MILMMSLTSRSLTMCVRPEHTSTQNQIKLTAHIKWDEGLFSLLLKTALREVDTFLLMKTLP